MHRPESLENPVLVLDGPMGTELERRGIPTKGRSWSAAALETYPSDILEVHRAHISAGADIITANTFRTNPDAQLSTESARRLTRAAVELALEARREGTLVAGSVAPIEDSLTPANAPISERRLFDAHQSFISWLIEDGVDIILIETMGTLRESAAALLAARTVRARAGMYFPIYLSLVPSETQGKLLSGIELKAALSIIAALRPDALLLNCAPISVMHRSLPSLSEAAAAFDIRWGIYANASERRAEGSWEWERASPNDFELLTTKALQLGAAIVGSCCGAPIAVTSAIANCTKLKTLVS